MAPADVLLETRSLYVPFHFATLCHIPTFRKSFLGSHLQSVICNNISQLEN